MLIVWLGGKMTKKELEIINMELANENQMLKKVLKEFGIEIKEKNKIKDRMNLGITVRYLFQGNGKQLYGAFNMADWGD